LRDKIHAISTALLDADKAIGLALAAVSVKPQLEIITIRLRRARIQIGKLREAVTLSIADVDLYECEHPTAGVVESGKSDGA
jgi:hypothetical protein